MRTHQDRVRAVTDREELLLAMMRDKCSVKEIAQRLGMEENYVKRERQRLAAQHGLSVDDGKTPGLAFGLTAASGRLRGKLGVMLGDLVDRDKMHPIAVAYTIGVPQKAQTKTKEKPYPHDWKLSELERLAAHKGKDFETFLKELLAT